MSLANLLNTPRTPSDFEEFFFSNRLQIDAIQKAILQQKNVNLTQYVLYPVSQDDFKGFLEANQQSHEDFNSVLGLQSSDLESVDLKDEKQLTAWTYLNYQELYSASAALKI